MKNFLWSVVILATVLPGVAWAKKEKKKSDSKWKLLSTVNDEEPADTLIVRCEKEIGMLVYLSPAHYGEQSLGRTIDALYQPDDCLKDGVVGRYEIPKGPAMLRVICDAERGNLVFLGSIFWKEKDFGSTIKVVHQPEDCALPPPVEE